MENNDFVTQNQAAEMFPVSAITLWRERKEGNERFDGATALGI